MISVDFPDGDQVLRDLGDAFVHAFIDAVEGAKDDYVALKEWRPQWASGYSGRFSANFLHERIWDRLVRAVIAPDLPAIDLSGIIDEAEESGS